MLPHWSCAGRGPQPRSLRFQAPCVFAGPADFVKGLPPCFLCSGAALPLLRNDRLLRSGHHEPNPPLAMPDPPARAHLAQPQSMIADDATLARLMVAAQAGDGIAYRRLLELCMPLLRRIYRRRVPDHVLDDLVQETLMAMHRKRHTWDPARPFLPWLGAIARYRWIDHLRRVYARPESAMDDDVAGGSGEPAIAARLGCDALLAHIPQGQAAAIRAVRIEGLSVAEAAAKLGQSEGLVKVNIHRGLKRMAAMVESDT